MFSSRLDWTVATNPLTRLLHRKQAAGEILLDLTESNPTKAGLTYYQGEILAALADSKSLLYEPAPAGLDAARSAVSEYYAGGVPLDRILLTASTSEAYGFLFKLLANPGDEVLVPRPSYPLFEFLAALESVRVVPYPLVYHGSWTIDFDALKARITAGSRAIVIVNPNNPTGSFVKKDELRRLAALCDAQGLAIISDEVFCDYALEENPSRVRSLVDLEDVLSFSLSGLSKVSGLPQMKLGWIVANGPESLRKQAVDRLELIADTYLSASTPVQWAAGRLLGMRGEIQAQIQARASGNLRMLREQIGRDSPWRVLEVEGGWYAVIEAPRIHTEEEWALTLLDQDNVLLQPGFFFDFDREAFLVVSLLTRPEIFGEGVRRILAHV